MTPSLFEAYYTTEKEVPEKIYLRVYTENSKWHVLARNAIRKL